MKDVVIGVDGGTTAVKAVAFTLTGQILASHHQAVPVSYGSAGQAEQDMTQIWEAVATCLAEVSDQIGDATVLGIGLTGQGDGVWLVDAEGEPTRPAAIWLDGRAADRVASWNRDGRSATLLQTTGTTVFGGLFPVLIEELAATEPQALAAATSQLNCKDWLRFKLTGSRATDYTEASRSFLDVRDVSGFSSELAADLGLTSVLRLLPEIRPADGPAVPLSTEAAVRTGLPEGTPVGVGMIDVAVTGMGLGLVEDNASWLILGTTGFVGTLLPSVSQRRSSESMVLATGHGTQVLEFMAPMTGTPNLDWIRTMLGLEDVGWDHIEQAARRSAPGSRGVIYLPYASPGGERAPFQDTQASASWQGMSLTTTHDDILRSVYEGVALSLVECIRELNITDDLVVSGGGFRSDLLCEILADATGLTVVRQDAPEAGARGAAVLALVSAGRFETIAQAAAALGTGMQTFAPNPAHEEAYRCTAEVFRATRQALQPVWPQLRSLRALTPRPEEI